MLTLLDLLGAGVKIRILGWIDPGLQRIGPFVLNIAAALENSIITLLAPPWNGARTAEIRAAAHETPLTARSSVPACWEPTSSTPITLAPVVAPSVVDTPVAPTTSPSSPTILTAPSDSGATRFTVRLGKTYYERGFFNVPVAFSQVFGGHGATIELHCGDERACLHAVLYRKANQQSGAPRIYGNSELAYWFQRRFRLDDTLKVTVLSPTSAVLI